MKTTKKDKGDIKDVCHELIETVKRGYRMTGFTSVYDGGKNHYEITIRFKG